MQKSHGQTLGHETQSCHMAIQSGTTTKNHICISCVVWEKVGAKDLLKSLQSNYLRAAAETMKTTPTKALETVLCIYPLDLAIHRAAYCTVYRLKCQRKWRDTRLGHTRLRWLHPYPFTLAQDKTLRRYQIHKGFKTHVPKRKDWLKPVLVANYNTSY